MCGTQTLCEEENTKYNRSVNGLDCCLSCTNDNLNYKNSTTYN